MNPRHLVAAFLTSVAVGLAGVTAAPVVDDTGGQKGADTPGAHRTIVKLAPGQAVNGQPRVVVLNKGAASGAPAAKNIEAGGPWLGVQFGPVPKPLASHLKLENGSGQMVLNVAAGSPADLAGLQQYDVITNIDGNAVSGDMGEFLDMVRGFAPNETHQFGLIRGGAPMNNRVVVGTRPEDAASIKYKYEIEEEPLAGGQMFQRGGMFEKDPQGNWQFKDLGQIDDVKDLFSQMPNMGPGNLQYFWQNAAPDHMNQMQIHVDQGNEVRIEKDDTGKITVTRVEKNGADNNTRVETFDDEAAFEAGDPDAFKMYKEGMGGDGVFNFRMNRAFPGLGNTGPDMSTFKFDFNDKDMQATIEKFQKQVEEMQKNAQDLRIQLRAAPGAAGAPAASAPVERKATTSFEVQDDGSVRVTTRVDGTELVEKFGSVEQMKNDRPDLFERYQAVRN